MNDKTNFFEKVFWLVEQIPYGRITSYGAIAEFLGSRGSARMVGWAMNHSHGSERSIPAHRVVNRNGMLTGKSHFAGHDTMQRLLEQEGMHIDNDCILNFKEKFWNPSQELNSDFSD